MLYDLDISVERDLPALGPPSGEDVEDRSVDVTAAHVELLRRAPS
jgi:hypothetical protein